MEFHTGQLFRLEVDVFQHTPLHYIAEDNPLLRGIKICFSKQHSTFLWNPFGDVQNWIVDADKHFVMTCYRLEDIAVDTPENIGVSRNTVE